MEIEFLASLSHELRTPLNSLLILAQQLFENPEGNLTDKQKQFIRTIYSCGDDLNGLINDILDLSKIKNGVLTAEFHSVNLKETANYLDSIFVPVAATKNISFNIDIDSETPEFLDTDNIRLNQILKNLISNAIKFTEKGEISVKIKMIEKKFISSGKNEASKVISFSIQDSGIGIPPEKYEAIFEAFNQVTDHSIKKYGGTGLGLFISKGLAELLGGVIEIQSKKGAGSVFTLFLPVEPPTTINNQITLFKKSDNNAVPYDRFSIEYTKKLNRNDLPKIKVLLVDDLEENLKSIESLFENEGYTFYKALSGKEAFKILLQEPDMSLILMDVQMPVMNGFETATLIYQTESLKDIPIIFITAFSYGDANLFKGYESGAVDYIFKPINPQVLKLKVAIFIELFRKSYILKKQEQKLIMINSELQNEIKERIKIEDQLKLSNQEKIQASLKEKELLMKEIYHRVKNNLQVISSLLNLQAGYIKDEDVRDIFIESRNRILSMALVHERLYKFNDLSKIDFNEYIEDLARNLVSSYRHSNTITFHVTKGNDIFLDLDRSISLGLCINELITNSLKHAFHGKEKGHIEVTLMQKENFLIISICDDGIGISENVNIDRLPSLGMQLVNSLIDQLNGTLELNRDNKTEFKITIPLSSSKENLSENQNILAVN